MKTIAALLVVAVVLLGAMLYRQNAALVSQQQVIDQLQRRRPSTVEGKPSEPHATSLEYLALQGKCAEQSKREFTSAGYKPDNMASYENHFNLKLNKCLMFVESIDSSRPKSGIFTNKSVSDAFEGKAFATYIWHSVEGKKYWEVPPLLCQVTLPTGEEQKCKSEDEFKDLIKVYME